MYIYRFVEAKKEHPELLLYHYPSQEGEFIASIVAAHFAPHSILHTFWDTEDGEHLDCCLFRDKHYKYLFDIEALPLGATMKLTLKKASSGKIWIREIREI